MGQVKRDRGGECRYKYSLKGVLSIMWQVLVEKKEIKKNANQGSLWVKKNWAYFLVKII